MNNVMSVLQATNKSLNILFLDACRSIPSFNRDSEQGWTRENTPRGSIIVFATEAGKVASDGNSKNGLFTSKLLTRIDEPGLSIGELLSKVKQDVFIESNEKQLPTVDDRSISANFIFTPASELNNQTIKQSIIKTYAPLTTSLDYGYGTSDAHTVKVGAQEWLGKNLNVDRFANGDLIPEAKTAEEWQQANDNQQPAWCYNNNDPANGPIYGKLYNWYAVNDLRGLAPPGWHVPSDDEWNFLINYLGGEEGAGTKMKDTRLWEANGNGSNESGFAGLPAGQRGARGTFFNLGKSSYWWSSSQSTKDEAWYRPLNYVNGKAVRRSTNMGCGFSVRCVRD